MCRLIAAIGFALAAVASPASAQYTQPGQLAKVRAVFVVAELSGDSSCLPTEVEVKAEAELVLRRAGLTVVDARQNYSAIEVVREMAAALNADTSADVNAMFHVPMLNRPHQLVVSFVALDTGRGCAVSSAIELWRIEPLLGSDPTDMALAVAFKDLQLLTGPDDMPNRLRTRTNAAATTIANEILKAREGR